MMMEGFSCPGVLDDFGAMLLYDKDHIRNDRRNSETIFHDFVTELEILGFHEKSSWVAASDEASEFVQLSKMADTALEDIGGVLIEVSRLSEMSDSQKKEYVETSVPFTLLPEYCYRQMCDDNDPEKTTATFLQRIGKALRASFNFIWGLLVKLGKVLFAAALFSFKLIRRIFLGKKDSGPIVEQFLKKIGGMEVFKNLEVRWNASLESVNASGKTSEITLMATTEHRDVPEYLETVSNLPTFFGTYFALIAGALNSDITGIKAAESYECFRSVIGDGSKYSGHPLWDGQFSGICGTASYRENPEYPATGLKEMSQIEMYTLVAETILDIHRKHICGLKFALRNFMQPPEKGDASGLVERKIPMCSFDVIRKYLEAFDGISEKFVGVMLRSKEAMDRHFKNLLGDTNSDATPSQLQAMQEFLEINKTLFNVWFPKILAIHQSECFEVIRQHLLKLLPNDPITSVISKIPNPEVK